VAIKSSKINDIGPKIRAWRRLRGLSVEKLAQKTGIVRNNFPMTRTVAWKWENNVIPVKMDNFLAICSVLDLNPAAFFLVRLEDIPGPPRGMHRRSSRKCGQKAAK